MYGVEWLIVLGLLGAAGGLVAGFLLGGVASIGGRRRQLETQLADAQQELHDYRQEVVSQFSETARKFQALNDAYTDLHEQLARSSSALCGDISGPLLAAPAGHQDLLQAETRADATSSASLADGEGDVTVDPYDDRVDIRVPEPAAAHAPETDDAAGKNPAGNTPAGETPPASAEDATGTPADDEREREATRTAAAQS